MAQFVLLGDAAESALLRGEENVGMGEAEMLDFWGASVWMSKKGKRKRLCMHASQGKQGIKGSNGLALVLGSASMFTHMNFLALQACSRT
jgi:hypothetical protein